MSCRPMFAPFDPEPTRRRREPQRQPPPIIECIICSETWPISHFPRNPNDTCRLAHDDQACEYCWDRHVRVQMEEGSIDRIRCIQCPKILGPEDLVEVMGRETNRLYTTKLWRHIQRQNPNYFECLQADCQFGYIPPSWEKIFFCQYCELEYCISCQVEQHYEESCAAYQARQKAGKAEKESSLWLKANAKACPQCSAPIQKRGGCNYMLCTRCKHEFCYGCFAPFEGPTGINELGQAGHKVGCNPAHAPEELFAAGILFVLLVMLLFAFATWVVRTTVREVFNAANAAADFGRM